MGDFVFSKKAEDIRSRRSYIEFLVSKQIDRINTAFSTAGDFSTNSIVAAKNVARSIGSLESMMQPILKPDYKKKARVYRYHLIQFPDLFLKRTKKVSLFLYYCHEWYGLLANELSYLGFFPIPEITYTSDDDLSEDELFDMED